jgi:hypothetical protein
VGFNTWGGIGFSSILKTGTKGRKPGVVQTDVLGPLELIGEDVMKELGRRLSDPDLAQRIPPSSLMSLATKYVNYLELKARQRRDDRQIEADMTVLQQIENPFMDAGRRLQIIDGYIAVAEAELKEVKARRRQVAREATHEAKVRPLVP